MSINQCPMFVFFPHSFFWGQSSVVNFQQKFSRITYLQRFTFFIVNYRHRHQICFRMAIIHQSKARGGKTIPFIHLFGTLCTPHILFLNIVFTTVPQSIFNFFISHHDVLKTNKIDVLYIKAKLKRLTEKLGHSRYEKTRWP